MANSTLTVIAGCNGSGKSTFSNSIVTNGVSYDYDKEFLRIYTSLIENELRDKMAHQLTRAHFENEIEKAILSQKDFGYETNFNSTLLFWPEHFRKAGYQIELLYFCLDSIDKAKERVQIRVENGGHYVPEHEIVSRYYSGYANLNNLWYFFDTIHLFDTSRYNAVPRHFLTLIQGESMLQENCPEYLIDVLPTLSTKLLKK